MIIDITNPEHLKALNHACVCALASNDPDYCKKLSDMTKGPLRSAFVALSNPARAADVIRQLVERAGVRVKSARPIWFGKHRNDPHAAVDFGHAVGDCSGVAVSMCAVLERVTRLLALPPNAGAEAVLAALRGKG